MPLPQRVALPPPEVALPRRPHQRLGGEVLKPSGLNTRAFQPLALRERDSSISPGSVQASHSASVMA